MLTAGGGVHALFTYQSALEFRGQHLFRMPRAAPAARIRVLQKALLERAGHDVQIIDGQLDGLRTATEVRGTRRGVPAGLHGGDHRAELSLLAVRAAGAAGADGGCANTFGDVAGTVVAVGPHASTTPRATLQKMRADVAVLGECEETLPPLAGDWDAVDPSAIGVTAISSCEGGRTPAT